MLDFNDAPSNIHKAAPKVSLASAADLAREKADIRAALNDRLVPLALELWPAGRRRQNKFLVGDLSGGPGDSLELVLSGPKAGLWTDRATGEGGDIFDLLARVHSLDVHAGFPQVLELAKGYLERTGSAPAALERAAQSKAKAPAMDDLGPATAKWDYHDSVGKLVAVVYRYDPKPGHKEFRPWDVRRRKMAPPDPRPLYNQPGLLHAEQVVFVEGEKCAQALIDFGVCATTAMHGANAPVEKTDWSPLSGKHVLIWPDRDKPGWHYADQASQAILRAGAKSCVILQPPAERPEGWDAADALLDGFDVAGFISVGERLPVVRQVEATDLPVPIEGIDYSTEDGLALAFSHQFAEDWRYCAPWGKWLVWDGSRWNVDKALYVMHLSRTVCRTAALMADTPKAKTRLASAATMSAIERLVRTDPRHSATVEEWDANVWLLNTPGGIVDLRTGARGPHDRARRMTRVTTATPQGESAVWRTFLDSVTGGDAELQGYLQRVVGYCLTGDLSTHALFFLYGTGANGKSVFVNVISTVLGDYAANAPMDTFMETRSDRHPTDLAGLRGARFVSATETEQGRRWNESKIKAITGGDHITARLMHQDFFTYAPQFKLLIAGNHKPAIRNIDEAMRRRMHLIPFTITVPPEKRDPRLTEKLLAERDGILAWALQGCLLWQQQGLKQPASVVQATEEYFEAEDAMGRWLSERCNQGSNFKALTATLFNDWKQWAELAGEYVGAQRRFSDALLARRFDRWRNSMGVRGYQGLDLKQPTSLPSRSYSYNDD
jgi:putative DNA primase/helicase